MNKDNPDKWFYFTEGLIIGMVVMGFIALYFFSSPSYCQNILKCQMPDNLEEATCQQLISYSLGDCGNEYWQSKVNGIMILKGCKI